jgi:hypothetical protein
VRCSFCAIGLVNAVNPTGVETSPTGPSAAGGPAERWAPSVGQRLASNRAARHLHIRVRANSVRTVKPPQLAAFSEVHRACRTPEKGARRK